MIGQSAAGSSVGTSLGATLSKWLGAGDYEVSRNSLVAKASSGIPVMHSSNQTVTVRHREYIGPISGSVGFAVQYQLTLNPGLAATFPWLSGIAGNFQEYNIKGAVFHYVPSSGMAISGTNSALGNVMIQTSYRSGDTPPYSKQSMLNEYWANECLPSEPMVHPIECDPRENPFSIHYVRSGGVPDANLLMYDLGVTYVCTQGMQAVNAVGDLWVTYEIELKKPIVSSTVTTLSSYYAASFNGGTATGPFAGTLSNSYGTLPVGLAGQTVTIPLGFAGTFVVHIDAKSTAGCTCTTGLPWFGASTFTNCVAAPTAMPATPWGTSIGGTSQLVYEFGYAVAVTKVDPTLVATIVLPNIAVTTGVFTNFYVTVYSLGLP
jgi:hypothetical protein